MSGGFTIVGYWQDPPVFAILERDGTELFFNQADAGARPRNDRATGAYDLYIRVSGLDSIAARLADRGATVLEGPILREYGMRELVVIDCNGLIVAVGEAV
jgi:predicted enzyme related to lactoylglutathione lyase